VGGYAGPQTDRAGDGQGVHRATRIGSGDRVFADQ
jgi:hypothetical protein